MSGTKVADLYTLLGLKVNQSQWQRGDAMINGMKAGLAGLAVYFGGGFLGKALVGFNANVQDTKTQIAGMLALTKKTDLADQVAVADQLYANLQRRAASLPGTTAEYAQMLGAVTQSITDAGLGLQDLEDITVNAVVGAKAFGIAWDVAARDIDQALRGQFKSVDAFSGKILGSAGFKGESGRERFNALSAKRRGEVLKAALTQKQLTQLAERQGQSFRGILSTVQDAFQQFFGRVGAPLFKAISEELKSWSVWLEANRARVDAFADAMATGIVRALDLVKAAIMGVVGVVEFFIEHAELGQAVLIAFGAVLTAFAARAALAWIIAFAPLAIAFAKITLFVLVVRRLVDAFKNGSTAMKVAIAAVALALGLLMGPIAPFAAAVAGIVLAVQAIADNWETVKEKIVEAIDAVEDFFGALGGAVDPNAARKALAERQARSAAPSSDTSMLAPVVPTAAPAYGGGAAGPVTNTLSASFTIQGVTDPQAVATVVDQRIQRVFSDAFDTRKGGR